MTPKQINKLDNMDSKLAKSISEVKNWEAKMADASVNPVAIGKIREIANRAKNPKAASRTETPADASVEDEEEDEEEPAPTPTT
jgi:hypothetical protein